MLSLFLTISILVSCDQCNSIDYVNFELTGDEPFIYIIGEEPNCKYKAQSFLFTTPELIVEEMYIKRNVNTFDFSIDASNYNTLFDLSIKVGESYSLSLESVNKQTLLKNVHTVRDGYIYEFIIKDVFFYEESYFDITFLVSPERFVEGCYLLAYDPEGKEVVISEQGNLFKDYIDYSSKSFGSLE